MATSPMSVVIQRLRTAFGQDGAGMTDGDLLTLFLDSKDEAPLAALVRRHAPMVWGICRRLLRSHHDAEDAFQATFLVLVRKSDSVKPREAVGNWLYGVAHQTAVRVRATAAKRGGRERQVADMPEPVVQEAGSDDRLSLLDQELSRLPDKHRTVIVLGDLEGRSRPEVARQLGVSEGTVAGRLARAREMLAKRLARRGLAMSSGALAAALSESAASASAPAPLVASTIQAASLTAAGQAVSAGLISAKVLPLTEGVVRAMFVSKIKSVLAVVLGVSIVLGGLGVGHGLFNTPEAVAQKGANLSETKPTAEVGATTAEPQVFTGTIRDSTQGAATKTATVIGRHGVLFIRSEARLDELKKRAPDLTPDKPLPKIDFARQSVVLIYALGNSSNNALALTKSDLVAKPPELGFTFRWYNGDMAGEEKPSVKFIYAVLPAKPTVNVTVTSSPTHADRDRTVTELSALLGGKEGGDIVDGLQAAITPQAATIKADDDILIDFTLHLADPGKARPEKFGVTTQSVFVWRGTFSSGRNHAFFVTTPDGKTALLRPQRIPRQEAEPLPVEITARQPYQLEKWAEAENKLKSLKALGLDTTTPGTYTITGLYEETAQEADNRKGGKTPLWGGSITSNTVTVEVKAGKADAK